MRVLLIEDDHLVGRGTRAGLELAGHAVDWVTDARSADEAVRSHAFELVVLDVGLPDRDGLQWLRAQRDRGWDVPVLVLTARDTVADKVEGLDSGADDYLVKPFDLDELQARLRAIERRRHGRAEPLVRHRGIVLDPAARSVTLDGEPVALSRREFALLRILLDQRGKAVSRQRIEELLYDWRDDVGSNAVEVHVHHLRKKLGADLVRTIRGVGYVIERDG